MAVQAVQAVDLVIIWEGVAAVRSCCILPEVQLSPRRRQRELTARMAATAVVQVAAMVQVVEQVAAVSAAGGSFVVSPNCFSDVIEATRMRGMGSFPDVLTPSECFTALRCGATALTVFHVWPYQGG